MGSDIRHTWFDRVLPWLLGAVVAALAWFTGNNLEFPPELWDEVAVAAKLRPPEREFPALWRNMLSFAVSDFGIGDCLNWLKLAGPVSLGLLAVMVFRLFCGYLPAVMKTDMRRTSWGRWIVRSIVVQGTLFFVLSEPVWRAGRVLSPEMLALLASVAILLLALLLVEKPRVTWALLMIVIVAVVSSEILFVAVTPFAFSLYAIFKSSDSDAQGVSGLAFYPSALAVVARRMVWVLAVCWIATVAANLASFRMNGGGGCSDAGVLFGFVRYLQNYCRVFIEAASPLGWLLMVTVVLIPMLIVLARIRALTDLKKFMPITYGGFLAVAGILAFMQSTGFRDFHFWRWAYDVIHSQYLLCLCLFATALTAMLSLCIFAVDVYFRNNGRLFREIFPEASVKDDFFLWRMLGLFRLSVKMLRPVLRLEPIVALALVVPFRFDGTVREMASIVNGIIRQTAVESCGAGMLFTDGSLDAAVEVAAFERGHDLKAFSMMSGSGRYDVAVRTRGVTNEMHRTVLAIGAADALRTWVMEKNPCVSNIALQVGLELWRRNSLPVPKAGGLVALTAGFPDGDAESYADSARSLAERILRLYADGRPQDFGYPELNRLFLFGQWRLSRMCRMRANEADGMHDSRTSEMENALADRLDRFNPEWQRVQEEMDWIGRQDGMRLTPREGLRLGLERADFRLARSYARKVVVSDADDVQANFALGMGYFTEKQYGRAEMHLKKCLVRAPREPAVLNNLAIVQLRLGRFDEAETNALQALSHFPDSTEIKTTLRHIRTAKMNGKAR